VQASLVESKELRNWDKPEFAILPGIESLINFMIIVNTKNMKEFLRSLLATVIGILISTVFIFLLLIVVMGAIVASSEKPVELKANSVYFLKLDRQIIDRQPESNINISKFQRDYRLGLNGILSNIHKAKNDNKIKGIYIEAKSIDAGYATIDEIRNALIDFRESGKFVVFYSEILTQKAYYLATASDKIFLNPQGMFLMTGLKLQSMHYKNAFKKIGIEPVVVKMGKYKSATESFDRNDMSEANREQLQRLVVSIWDNMSYEIKENRNIDIDSFNYAIDNLKFETPEDCAEFKLVDSLLYKSEVLSYLKNILDVPENKDIKSITHDKYLQIETKSRSSQNKKVAVIFASGTILDGEADDNNTGSEKYARLLRKVRKDSSIKAIVLRVNSPGGSGLASEVILDEINRTKGIKPIVVSMGDVAASGGYYISCGADSIIAGKNTITGSIGVFFRAAEASELLRKIGISTDRVKTHKHADIYSFTRPYSEEEIAYTQRSIENMYNLFLDRVSEGRKMDRDTVHFYAQGRVWSGFDASIIGLVDSYGGLTEAISAAKYLANLDDDTPVEELPKQITPLEKIMKDLSGETKFQSTMYELGIDNSTYQDLKLYLQCQGVVAAMPYTLRID
jgi:protease-4